MGKTLTDSLAANMAACKQAQNDLLKEMDGIGKVAAKRHDAVAGQIAGMDDGPERDTLDAVRNGLLATCQYAEGMREQVTGKARKPPQRHEAKDPAGKFTTKGSFAHRLRQLLSP